MSKFEEVTELIKQKASIENKITEIFAVELDKFRAENCGNGHYIQDIYYYTDHIILSIWYDDWETSQKGSIRINKER